MNEEAIRKDERCQVIKEVVEWLNRNLDKEVRNIVAECLEVYNREKDEKSSYGG